jgi:hypothetical protein
MVANVIAKAKKAERDAAYLAADMMPSWLSDQFKSDISVMNKLCVMRIKSLAPPYS